MTQTTTKALPECLTRTAADDRTEARTAYERGNEPAWASADAALAAVLSEQAEAVFDLAHPLPRDPHLSWYAIPDAAERASESARYWCRGSRLTLPQRARLLDAARALVALAIEVGS